MKHYRVGIACICAFALPMFADRSVPTSVRYERLVCIVPMTGAGTMADPNRPLFAPLRPDPTGVMAFSFQLADDGKSALVEYVAQSPKTLAVIEADSRTKCFNQHKHSKDSAEQELKKAKKDFDFSKFGTNVQ